MPSKADRRTHPKFLLRPSNTAPYPGRPTTAATSEQTPQRLKDINGGVKQGCLATFFNGSVIRNLRDE